MPRLKRVWTYLDVPSGAVLGVYTGSMIVMSWAAFFTHKALPDGVVTAYLGVVGAFTAHNMFAPKAPEVVGPDE